MYCTQCGTKNNDSAAFCGNCGTRLADNKMSSPQSNSDSVNVNTTNTVKMPVRTAKTFSKNPVLNEIKKLAASPLMIITAVAFSLMVIFYISNAEAVGVDFLGNIRYILDEVGPLDYDTRASLVMLEELFGTASRMVAVVIMIPDIVVAIGIWITVGSVFNQSEDKMSVSGLTAIRVVNTISLVLSIIGTGLYVVSVSMIVIKAFEVFKEYGDVGLAPFIMIFVLLLLLAAMIFRIYCLNKMNDLVDRVKYVINSRCPVYLPVFVAVMTFITGCYYVLLALMGMGAGGSASTWCGAIAYLGFGEIILIFNKKMDLMRRLSVNESVYASNTSSLSSSASASNASASSDSVLQSNNSIDKESAVSNNNSVVENNMDTVALFFKKYFKFIIGGLVAIGVIVFVITSTSSKIDEDLVGKWAYGDNLQYRTEFKRNGVVINNKGTEYEETGTYTAEDGIISIKIDGDEGELEYRVVDDDMIQIYRSYTDSNWETKYRWESFYRLD